MELRSITLGLVVGVLLTGCASFSYRYYGLEVASYDGKLLGPTPEQDLPFTNCAPDDLEKGKCVVMLKNDFFAFKQDYELTKQELKDCQAPK